MDEVITKVMAFIERYSLIRKHDRVLMSLSAGKDSMFLLHALRVIGRERCFETGIFHLNHMTRGPETDSDEAHVAACARLHGLEIFIKRHDFTADDHSGVSFEERARNVRYWAVCEIAAAHGFNKIATGHTMDDNIETVLMRVFGGTGIHGLRGIPPQRDNIIRPLLSITSDEIYDYLKEHAIEWREDDSNNDQSYTRNFIRKRVLPLAREKYPMLDGSISSLSELAGDTVGLLDRLLLEKYGERCTVDGERLEVNVDALIDDPPAFRHIVSKAIRDHFAHPVNRSMLEEIFSKYSIGRANIDIYSDRAIHVEKTYREGRNWLQISRKAPLQPEEEEWEYRVDLDTSQELKIVLKEIGIPITVSIVDSEYFNNFRKNKSYIFLALENNIKTIYIRNRRKGDRIKTEQGTKKIKDLMIELKLDSASKGRVPLIAAGDAIAACLPGLLFNVPNRVSSDFLVDKKSKKVLAVYKN